MPDLYQQARIGETRGAVVERGQIIEMRLARDGDGVQAGARLPARLVTRLGVLGIADLDGEQVVVEPWPQGASEGARLEVEVTRAAWREPGRDRLAKARPARKSPHRLPDSRPLQMRSGWPEGIADQWEAGFEAAMLGRLQEGPALLGFVPTPAFVAVDVDGAGPGLALPALQALARAIALWGLGGSIVIDLPGPLSRADRLAAAAHFDARMGTHPFERTAINGFGLMQLVCPRPGPSVLERAQLEPAANSALALLESARRETRPGRLRLVARPDAARWLHTRPHLLAMLSGQAGRPVDVVADAMAGSGHVETHV